MFCKLWALALNLFWSNKEVLKSFFCRKKLASNFFVLCLFSVFVSCQVEEDLEEKKASGEQFKTEIQDYLNSIAIKKIEGSLFTAKDLIATINYQSTRAVVLNDVQTLLIADLGNVTDNDKAIATKLVLYLHKDGIKQAKIITFENYFSDYNSTIKYMLNNENEELAYSGKVLIHSIEGRFEFSGTLDQGRLKAHSRAFPKTKDILAKTTRYCTSWYRIDRIGEEIISVTFLFKTCESENDSDGGVSGDSEGTGEWAIFPVQPQDKAKFTHFSPDGIMTVYQYNAARNSWNIIAISLPELAIPNHAAHNQHLQHVQFPQHQQIVIGTQFTYQYNSFSGTWLAEPMKEVVSPCTALKNSMADLDYKAKLKTLKDETGNADHKERGFKELFNGTFVPLVNGDNGTNRHSLDLEVGSNTKGYLHNHIDPYPNGKFDIDGNPILDSPIHMFSPADVEKFIELIKMHRGSNTPLGTLYGTMISSSGMYTIKYNGAPSADLTYDKTNINEVYLNYFKKYTKEKAFLLFLKEKIGIDGLELYKINSDGTADLKSLNANQNVQKTPCNN